ncbi:helix-turn-helix domain-containing protein [Georgenia sp. AZ-5]|uniref:helix-turn-helix domain-containing protein n=1 Tax=Georgenia sp. AZ-5 TaxID=3367526 RepID=UPI003754758C
MRNADRPVPQYPIEGVDRVLRALTLFKHEPELRLADVRERLGVGQSTAHRLMAMLVYRGFACRTPPRRSTDPDRSCSRWA